MIRPLALLAAAAVIAAFAAYLVLAQLAGQPDGKVESAPAFLTKVLGAPQSAAPLVRKPAAGVEVAVRKSGFRVAGAGAAVSLGSPATGGAWTRHADGATRPASFGHETVLVDGDRTEQFLTVTERQGDRVWRWPVRTTLDPRLSPAGVVGFVDPKTRRLSDLVIPAVEILDADGEKITPAGLRWSLASKGSKHWLELSLDDKELQLPYVIDPAIVYRTSSAGASNGAGTTSVAATVPAGVLDGDLMIAHVAVRGSTVAIGAPGGWTLERLSTVASGTSMRLATYSRRASSTDAGTNYSWSLTPAARAVAGISVWAGVDTTIAINDAENAPGSNSTTITLPAVAAATLRIGVGGIAADNTFPATCAAGATCPRRMAANNANGISSGVYDGYAATGSSIATTGTSTRRIGQSLSVTVDSTLPTASVFTFPASLGNYNTAGWNAGCATNGFCGTASDPQSGINSVSVSIQRVSTGLYWNGAAFSAATETWNAATLTGGVNWAYTFPAANFPADGDYTVHVRATDNSNNVENPGPTRTFKIDRVVPASNTLSLTSVAPAGSAYLDLPGDRVYYRGSVAGGGSFRIRNAVTDNAGGSGPGSSQTAALGGTVGGWTHTPSTVSSPVGGPYDSNTFNWPQNETASPTEDVTGRDLANNSLAAPTLMFTNDSTAPPAPAITFPAAASYNTAGWNAGCAPVGLCGTSAADGGSGLATVEVSIRRVSTGLFWDGSAFASAVEVFNTPTGTSTWNYAFAAASFPADGGYAANVRSTDRVGNSSTTSVTLTYDTTAPVLPTGLASAPVSPANDNSPEILGTVEAASTVRVYATSDCSGPAAATGTAAAFAAPGLTVAIPDNTTGSYYATATDASGNVSLCSTDTVSYTEDSTAPANPSGLAASPASPANDNNPEVSGTAEAGSTVRIYTTTDCSGAPETSGSEAAFATGLTAAVADDSASTFKATATDAAGNISACSSGVTYLEDSTAPSATMDDPGAFLSDTVGLTATTSDGGSGIATVVFERRTAGGGTWTATPALWDTTTVDDGPYDIRAIATDNAGNSTTSASVDNRVVDNVAPAVILVSPGTYVNAAAADPLTLTASSPDGDVDQVEFFACSNTSAGCASGSWSSLGVDTTAPYSASWPIPTDGNRALRAVVRDYAGHTGSDVVETLVDRTAPAGGSIDYADGYDADGSVAITTDDGGDSGSGLDLGSRVIQRDSATLAANACGSFPDSWSGVTPPDTTIASGNCYRYRLRIADNAGNVATYTSGNAVKVDTVAPTATLDDPGANLRATVNLTATTGDTGGSGIADTTFQYAPASTGSWTTTPAAWNTMLVADGLYDLRVVVVDNAGNQTTHSIANRRVDNTPPTATMDNPGAYLRGAVTLTSSSADAGGSGVASVSYERSPAGAGTWGAVAANWDTTSTADGLYDLRAVATDNAGNVTTSAAVTNVRVDNTLPDVTMNSPGAIVGGTVNLTANATDAGSGVDTVVYEYSPGGAGSWTVTPASWNTTTIADGLYDLRATATDRAGNTRISAAVAGIRVDNTAPTVSFASPVEGAFVNAASADPYTLAANAADTGSGVATVEFFACSDTSVGCASGTWSSLGSDATPAWEGSWPLPADGGRALRAVATDNAGRTAEALVNVVVDRTVPDTTMLTTPANPSNDGTPDFSFSSTEAGSTFECRVDGSSWSACSTPHSPASLPDGTHTVEVRAVDAAGNRDLSPASWTWLLDTTLPIAGMTDPGANLRDVVTLTSTTSDPGGANASGIASITYEYSVAGAETWVATPDAWDTTAISDGLYDVRVVVADNAGNVTQSAAVEDRRVDNTPPATALDDPGANIRATVTLNGSATDAGSGVQEVVFEVSPAGFGTWTTIAVASAFPYQVPLDTTTLADGFYDFRTVARDVAGNQTESAPVLARRVDNTPPVGVMNDPGALLRATVNLTSVSDDPGGSGVSSVAYEYAPTGSGAWQPASPAWNTASVPDGVYDLRVVVTDVAGNVTQSTPVAGRRVDNTPPTTSDNAPSGYQRNDVTVSLGATDGSGSGVSSTQFAVDGGSWQSGNSVTIPAPSDGSNDGIHTISYFSTDLAGNIESPRTAAVAIDATAPIAGGEDPGNYLTGTITLSANPSDDGGTGIASVEFQRSPAGQGNWTTIGLDDTGPGPYTADWDTVASGDGAYDLRFVVTDVAQNTTIQDLPAKIVDNTAPTAAVGSPPAGSTVSGGVSIGATALDANPIANVEFYVDGTPVGGSASPPFTIAWDSTGHGDGPASIHVTVTDIAGNSTTSSAISITVDNLAPAVSLGDPGSSVHGSVGLSASADGDTVQVVFERRPASGGGWSAVDTDTSAPWSATFDTTLVADGNYELRATATDAGANSSSSNVVTTRVDNTNPSGALSAPGDGQTVGGPSVQLAATASDSGSGVGSVTFEARAVSGGWGTIASVSSSPYQANWDTTALASGDYELRALIADGAGNTFTTGTIVVTVDSSAPGVTLDDPGSQISGNVTLSASTTGDAATVTFSFSPAGASSWTQVGTADTSPPWSRNFATTGVPDGVYDLRAVVSDAVGNTSVSVRAGVRVDNTAPSLVSSVPAGGSIVSAVSSVELTFSEAIAALENVELDGAPAVAPIVSGSVATYNTGALDNGPHTLRGTVRDGAGKAGAFSVSFVVGVAPPPPPSGGEGGMGDFTSVTPIDAPSGFEAFVGADGTLTLRWQPVMFEEEQLTTILLIDGVAVRSFEPGVSSVNLGPFTADDTRTFALAAVGPDGTLGAQTPTVRALPMLVGLTLEEATALLEARGFEVGRVTGTGTVVRPIGVTLATVGSAIPLELSSGEAPETRFVFDVASAKTFSWAKRTWVGTRISTTRFAQVTVSLLDSRGRRVHRWRLSVEAGAAVVKLRMPTKARREGKYKLEFAAQSGLVTAKRTRPLEIVGKKSKPVPPSRKPVEVVVAAGSSLREEIARGMGPRAVVTTAESDAAFSLTADTRRRVEVVVVDVDRFGVGLVRDLRIVFPNVRILALSDDRKRLAQAVKAGATVAVPRSTPAPQLAKLVKRLALRRG